MVCRCHDGDEDPRGIGDAQEDVEDGREAGLSVLSGLENVTEDTRVVEHRTTDAEGKSKMHRRYSGEGVDVFSAHPNALGVVMAHAIQEAVLSWKEPRGHTRVENKIGEGEKVGEGHSTSHNSCKEVSIPSD